MPSPIRTCLATLSILTLLGAAEAADRSERVRFPAGLASATINGRIKGDDAVSYEVGAAKGQRLSVSFIPENPSCYFNLLPPGSDTALHDGQSAGNTFSGTLPVSGDYVTQIYLMQDAALANEICDYSISFEITG